MRVASLALALLVFALPCEAGVVVLKNGEVVVGRISPADDTDKFLIVRWPYGERTTRGMLSIPKYRVRWYDRSLDAPSSTYWELFADAPIDPDWHAAREQWRKERDAAPPRKPGQNPLAHPPAWVGVYHHDEVRLTLQRTPDGFGGTLEVGGAVYRVEGPPPRTARGPFEGIFRRAGERFRFTAAFSDDGLFTLSSDSATYRLRPPGLPQVEAEDPKAAPRDTRPPPPRVEAEDPPSLQGSGKPKPAGKVQKLMTGLPKPGATYRFRLTPAPGTEMEMSWEVVEVGDTQLRYRLTTFMGGKPVGPPTELSMGLTPPQNRPGPNQPPIEEITLAGRRWSCWRIESAGVTTWVPQDEGRLMFPPYLLQKKGDRITGELVGVQD